MRMWMVDPKTMCRKHLLGEHVECHMFIGTVNKGIKFDGYLNKNLFEPCSLKERHDLLAEEITRRGYNHKSDLPALDRTKFTDKQFYHKIDKLISSSDLMKRCPECLEKFRRKSIPILKNELKELENVDTNS